MRSDIGDLINMGMEASPDFGASTNSEGQTFELLFWTNILPQCEEFALLFNGHFKDSQWNITTPNALW